METQEATQTPALRAALARNEGEPLHVRLSAVWMTDHLEVWDEDSMQAPDPDAQGEFRGAFWVGWLVSSQVKEIRSRADYYTTFDGEDRRNNRKYCDAAARVLAALDKQAPGIKHKYEK